MAGKPKPRHPVTQPLDKPYRFIALTQGQTAIVDLSDFDWLSQWNWFAHWCPDTQSFYAARAGASHRTLPMHRQILGCGPKEQGDHKNHDTLDNRRENLRKCIKAHNSRNQRKRRDNISGFKGVDFHYKGWRSRIMVNRKLIYIGGHFASAEEAARAYDEAAKEHFGEFASLNFPAKLYQHLE